jgi:hypothetical protein
VARQLRYEVLECMDVMAIKRSRLVAKMALASHKDADFVDANSVYLSLAQGVENVIPYVKAASGPSKEELRTSAVEEYDEILKIIEGR